MYRRSCVTLIWNSLNFYVYARPLIHCLYLNRPRCNPSSSRLNKEKYLQLKNAVSIPEKKRDLLEQGKVCMESLGNVSTFYVRTGWLRWRKTENSQRDRLGWFYDYHSYVIVRYSYAFRVCSLIFSGVVVLKVLKQNWNCHFFLVFLS